MSFWANAQDMMLLRNGDEIQCKVDMISNGTVSYQENGTKSQMPTTQLYMIKYEKRGNAFFNSDGESSYNSESSSAKLSKKDIAIYLCDGGEVIASEVKLSKETVDYKTSNKKTWNAITGFLPVKKSGDWSSLNKEKVFLIRYFDGSREVINDLQKLEADIENKGCRYRKVKGQYGSKENSYMIIGISLEEAKELAAKYCQESFIFANVKKTKGDGNRRSNMRYQFWQLGSDYYQSCLEEFVSLNEDLGVEAERDENEHITKVNIAGDVDVEDSLEFPEVDPNEYHIFTKRDITNDMAGEDDYFTQFKDFKFSIPFFDDKGDDTTEDD